MSIIGVLGALTGIGRHSVNTFLDSLHRRLSRKRTGLQHPGTYRGCRANKFATMTRQRIRAEARHEITKDVRSKFLLPRRILRAIVRTRVNREWRDHGTVERIVREATA
jgi:hypothetical protein